MQTPRGDVHICATQSDLGKGSAAEFIKIVNAAIAKNGRATVALSGGHSPPLLYAELVKPENKSKVDWSKVHFFISDERCVPHDSKDSNWGLAQQHLFSNLNIPEGNFHPTQDQDKNSAGSARQYEEALRTFFESQSGEIPRFDLIQLGMGPDGHTASLFPGTKALAEKARLVTDNFVEKLASHRITFTIPLLNNAAHIMFIIEGEEKSHVLAEVLNGSDIATYPVQKVSPASGTVVWFIDQPAGKDLLASVKK